MDWKLWHQAIQRAVSPQGSVKRASFADEEHRSMNRCVGGVVWLTMVLV